ncbi:MAG: enoyl-CoA hydratase [Actinomycetia bacterium]|nr:enoyl-CoA hydratase [Actinomycetes bacterium]
MSAPIHVSGDAVRTLVLQREATMNALDETLHSALLDALEAIATDDEVRAVVITGAGRAFSAGGDIELIRAMQHDRALRSRILETARRLFARFVTLDVPVIAAVNGPAVGAGCTLVLLCDVIYMAEEAYLADPHIRIGLVPGDGGAVLWPLLAGLPAARAYLLSGDRLPAAEAHRIGLVHRVVAADELRAVAHGYAERIAALPRAAVRDTKRALNVSIAAAAAASFDTAMHAESSSFDTIEHQSLTSETS